MKLTQVNLRPGQVVLTATVGAARQ
jgi:hypothetical protein